MKTAQEFRAFFEAIPDEKWDCGGYWHPPTGACCAYGHLGVRLPIQEATNGDAQRLGEIFAEFGFGVVAVNDGKLMRFSHLYGAKARILAALDEIIAKEKGQQ